VAEGGGKVGGPDRRGGFPAESDGIEEIEVVIGIPRSGNGLGALLDAGVVNALLRKFTIARKLLLG
jgi:hypothetical protein